MKDKKSREEFFLALRMLEKEKGIPMEYLVEKIQAAIAIAVKRDYGVQDNVRVTINPETNEFSAAIVKTIVDEVTDDTLEISVEAAAKYTRKPVVGNVVEIKLDTRDFGRIAAQSAKHVIHQGIREAERGQQIQEFQKRTQELVSVLVTRVDPQTGNATIQIGTAEAVLPKSEQIEGEVLVEGSHIKVYIVEVRETEKGPRAFISRTNPGLVKRLFELEVPEIFNGVVEIKAISREAGSRTKMAVFSHESNVDAVGACIGPKGARVGSVVNELGGEKIDIVEYSEDPAAFISAALAPAKVLEVEIDPDVPRSCRVTVPDSQLSLAIGNKGQNARLAARLTGWKIDIRPESGSAKNIKVHVKVEEIDD